MWGCAKRNVSRMKPSRIGVCDSQAEMGTVASREDIESSWEDEYGESSV